MTLSVLQDVKKQKLKTFSMPLIENIKNKIMSILIQYKYKLLNNFDI